ncbi:MAG: methionine--tRNA ligase [Chlamydiales bacterium]|nr:methionine--tRNA ligase [Chlamydiales bacterium]
MSKKVLITSALPYANGPLHFGHIAGAYLPADCYARFERLKGSDVLFISGSDEYGIAITLSAEMAKRSPKEHVDIFHKINKDFFDQLHISFDHYSRTTWDGHAETTKEFFFDLLKNGYIEAKVTDQLYSENDKQFLADRYVEGTCPKCGFKEARGDECPSCGASYEAIDLIHPISKVTRAKLVKKPTKHWFLLFDKFKEPLAKWIQTKHWKANVTAFAQHYIDELKPRAITRDSDWGIPVPLKEAEGKVFYVWFDAPIGYISATKEWAQKIGDPEKWKDYWLNQGVALVQFIGKDNIPFHAVFFPAMIMGQNKPYNLVSDLPANEFYKLEGKQFSKSSGWYIDLKQFFEKFTTDQIRYVIASNAPETSDSEFLWKDFQSRCNADLVGKYGNLANRTLTFIHTRMNKEVPPCGSLTEKDQVFISEMKRFANEIATAYSSHQLRKASSLIMELSALGNAYFDHAKPWVLLKEASSINELNTSLHLCIYCLQVLALVSSPIIPTAAGDLWEQLGYKTRLEKGSWETIIGQMPISGTSLPMPHIIFKKIEDDIIQEEIQKLNSTLTQSQENESKESLITFDEFSKVKLKVGEIIEAKKVEKSNKLLHLTVSFGDHKRSIVSGIAKSYVPEDIIGKKAVFVVNLVPTKLMGIPSEGMLLCAKSGDMLEIPALQQTPAGSDVS